MTAASREVSLAHLTLIDVPPPTLVRVAAEAGYDAVGLRITPVGNGPDYSMPAGSASLRATAGALLDTGLRVLDVEVVRLRPDTDPVEYDGFLDSVAELGAPHVVVTGEDPDPGRAAATLATFCLLAVDRGVTAMLEFMVFSQVKTLSQACALIAACGQPNAGILVDPLHLARSGSAPELVGRLPAALVPYLQICDADSDLPAVDDASAQAEARRSRLLPGAGVLPLADLVASAPPRAALSLEVPDGWSNPDPVGRARTVLDAARPLLGG